MADKKQEIDWYARRDELEEGMVFRSYDDSFVKLDHRKPGDGSRWVVADWHSGWSYYESTIEPGDLRGEPIKDFEAAISKATV